MTVRVAFLGAGAVGAPAALLAARSMKDAEVTVFDSGQKAPGSRTFVLLCGVCERLKDAGAWDCLEGKTHRIASVKSDFEGSFGSLSLASEDCEADHVGHSIAEEELLHSMRSALEGMPNVRMLIPAKVSSVRVDGEVQWQGASGEDESSRFDVVAVAGLPERLLVDSGFSFSTKEYEHLALVSTFSSERPADQAHERFLADGASALVPRRDGYGHILVSSHETIRELENMDEEEFTSHVVAKGWMSRDASLNFVTRGSYAPRMRVARRAGMGRIALLGASACTVHPIGAQELNLGLRDAVELSSMLSESTEHGLPGLAGNFAARRESDRRRIARITDFAATVTTMRLPGKLCVAGLAATAVDLCPPARRAVLGAIVLP